MIETISKLIEENNISQAAALLSEAIQKNGFNDELAVLAATINMSVGDTESFVSMIESGLDYNPANYELLLMKADFYSGSDVETAYNCYEASLMYALYRAGEESSDYDYIRQAFLNFKDRFSDEIKDYEKSLPIMIYKSEPICYGVLNYFADLFVAELERCGEKTEIVDVNETPPEKLSEFCGKRFKAIFGIQTYLFSIKFNDGRNMHDFIFGPKFNMIFDHPACMYNHLTNGPGDYTVLTHDRFYVDFTKRYYPQIKDVKVIAPGGAESSDDFKKEYDVVFVGSYKSPDTWRGVISDLDRIYNNNATKLIEYMKSNPNEIYEECVRKILGEKTDTEVFFDLKQTYFVVMSYYREEILKSLLECGIKIDVFGDSWECAPWDKYKNMIVHDEISPEESLNVYKKSKMSLNIMSWHKDGRTERVANSMLNGSLVVSDKCRYLTETYVDGEEIILFDLENIGELGERLLSLLDADERIDEMQKAAYQKAIKSETWEERAKEFLNLV